MEEKLEPETPTTEVRALCTLLARILYRGLAEQDPRALALLSPSAPAPTQQAKQEVNIHAS